MTVITFKLNDFGIASMANLAPRVLFIPAGPGIVATAPDDLLVPSKRIPAVLDPDGVTFTVSLFPSSWSLPVATYRMVIEWLDSAGNFISRDAPPWEIFIPVNDANLSDIVDVPLSAFWVWVDGTPQTEPVPGAWWLNSTTGDLYEWEA